MKLSTGETAKCNVTTKNGARALRVVARNDRRSIARGKTDVRWGPGHLVKLAVWPRPTSSKTTHPDDDFANIFEHWAALAYLEAERRFPKIQGHRDLDPRAATRAHRAQG